MMAIAPIKGQVYRVDPKTLRPHPLAKTLGIPDLEPDAYRRLKRSVKLHGMRHPLVALTDDTVLDGHHRLRIALELGLEAVPVLYEKANLAEAAMIECALMTRILSVQQRIELAERQAALVRQWEAKKRGNETEGMTQMRHTDSTNMVDRAPAREVAEVAGVSRDTVQRHRKVQANPEVAALVKSGQLSIGAGAAEVKRRENAASAPAIAPDAPTDPNPFQARMLASGGIPEALAEYAAMHEHEDALDQIEKLKRAAGYLKAPYEALGFTNNTSTKALKQEIYHLQAALPWDACPCQREEIEKQADGRCGWCKGAGWLSKSSHEAALGALEFRRKTKQLGLGQ